MSTRPCEQERHGQFFPKLNRNELGEREAAINPKESEMSDWPWESDFWGLGTGRKGRALTAQGPVLRPSHSQGLGFYLPSVRSPSP